MPTAARQGTGGFVGWTQILMKGVVMFRIVVAGFVAGVACLTVLADEPPKAAAVKKLAQELGDATLKGDYAKVIDHTHGGIVELLGGKEKAVQFVEKGMKQLKAQGITFKAYQAGEPGEFVTEGSNTFVVVPTRFEMGFPGGKVIAKSYLLGISPDDGKTWKFVDGAGLDNKDFREKGVPKLPAKLKLPEKEKPEVIKDK
jgi:hypothetical protein